MNKLSVIVPYYSNKDGLAVTLTQLQSQIIPPEQIIVIDTSPDKSGLPIAERYNANTCEIIVDVGRAHIYTAWNRGIELAGENDCLIINDDLLIPQNLVQVLGVAREHIKGWAFVPANPGRTYDKPNIEHSFEWYSDPTLAPTITDWMVGFCFLLTRECIDFVGTFDERFQVWFGDDDYQRRIINIGRENPDLNPIVLLENLYVHHFGGSSYEYKSDEIKKLIDKDRELFKQKYI